MIAEKIEQFKEDLISAKARPGMWFPDEQHRYRDLFNYLMGYSAGMSQNNFYLYKEVVKYYDALKYSTHLGYFNWTYDELCDKLIEFCENYIIVDIIE